MKWQVRNTWPCLKGEGGWRRGTRFGAINAHRLRSHAYALLNYLKEKKKWVILETVTPVSQCQTWHDSDMEPFRCALHQWPTGLFIWNPSSLDLHPSSTSRRCGGSKTAGILGVIACIFLRFPYKQKETCTYCMFINQMRERHFHPECLQFWSHHYSETVATKVSAPASLWSRSTQGQCSLNYILWLTVYASPSFNNNN